MRLILSLVTLLLCALAASGCIPTNAVAPAAPVVAAAPMVSQADMTPIVEERVVEIKECTKQVGRFLQTDTCANCATFPISLRVPGACK